MINVIVEAVIGLVILIFITLIGFYSKSVDRRTCGLEARCKSLENETNRQEIELTKLRGKLWSEDKLIKNVKSAVKEEFLTWENRLLKNGAIRK